MTRNHETGDERDRPHYVDRQTAEDVQRERADGRRRAHAEPSDGESSPGVVRRLQRWLTGSGPTGRTGCCLVVAALVAVLAGCVDTTDPTAASGAESASAGNGRATDDQAAAVEGSAVCEDGTDDLVVLQDGVPTAEGTGTLDRSDLVHAEIHRRDGDVEFTVERAERGHAPGDDAWIEFHLQSLADPTVTGIVRIGFPASPTSDFTAAVGHRGGPVTDVPTISSALGKTRATTAIAVEDLPVEPPFAWYVVHREEVGVGDVCPDVTGFTADGDVVRFPDDAESMAAALPTVDVEGVSFGYRGVPDTAAIGTRLAFRNAAGEAPHELVLVRLEADAPPVDDFLRLPMAEGMAVSELVGVSMALPGADGMTTKGDLVLDQPGTYVLLCALSVDTTAAQVAEHPYGPPADAPRPSGEPHLARGMVDVIEVE